MPRIFDIRGTHGSGKSTLVRKLLADYQWGEKIIEQGELLGYYLKKIDCGVIARYTETGGGCDGIKTADEVVRRIRLFYKNFSKTVLEGVLVSHTYDRYASLADELGRENYYFLFLDTPLNVCISRVERRRKAKNNFKPLDPKNIVKDYECDWIKLRPKFEKNGYKVFVINWSKSYACFKKHLQY